MRCGCCGKEVVYCGPQVPHFSSAVPVQEAEAPFRLHTTYQLPGWHFVVPMLDGTLIWTMPISFN